MKKIIVLSIFVLMLTGCFKTEEQKREDSFKRMAADYYEKYAKEYLGVIPDKFDVSIYNLKSANDRAEGNFDLQYLSNCEDESKVSLLLDEKGEIEGYSIDLNCQTNNTN